MNLETVKLVYFSPTNTSRKVVAAVAKGINAPRVNHLNLTLSGATSESLLAAHADLTIIAAPVYAGRIPEEALKRMENLQGDGKPALIIVMYGNRAYEDALIELRDFAVSKGFVPIAAGAFIGEHSFSTPETPIAARRPDAQDITAATTFGSDVRALLEKLPTPLAAQDLNVPGNVPYQTPRLPKGMAPTVDEMMCTLCGSCAMVCPTNAITIENNTLVTDASKCIMCAACVKSCTTGGRVIENELISGVRTRLTTLFSERQEPSVFFLDAAQ